jgi:hypothetical protein
MSKQVVEYFWEAMWEEDRKLAIWWSGFHGLEGEGPDFNILTGNREVSGKGISINCSFGDFYKEEQRIVGKEGWGGGQEILGEEPLWCVFDGDSLSLFSFSFSLSLRLCRSLSISLVFLKESGLDLIYLFH